MKNNNLFLLCLLLCSCINSFISAQSETELKYMKACQPAEKSYYEEIPTYYHNGMSFIEVTINGKKYNFLVDTGSSSSIDKSIAEELNLKTVFSGEVTDGSNIKQTLDYTIVPQITIGKTTFNNVPADMYDYSNFEMLSKCIDIKGIIGVDILKNGICQFTKEKIIITDNIKKIKNLSNSKPNKLILSRGYNPIFNVALKFSGKDILEVETLFDSGMSDYFNWSEFQLKMIQKLNYSNYTFINGKGHGYMTAFNYNKGMEEINLQKAIISELNISNNSKWNDFECVITDERNNSVGGRFLELADITIDWKKKKYYVQQNDQKQSKDFGFNYNALGYIIELWDDSPLIDKGIQFGDVISTVDNKVLGKEEVCEIYLEEPKVLSKNSITLKMKDSDEGITFEQ